MLYICVNISVIILCLKACIKVNDVKSHYERMYCVQYDEKRSSKKKGKKAFHVITEIKTLFLSSFRPLKHKERVSHVSVRKMSGGSSFFASFFCERKRERGKKRKSENFLTSFDHNRFIIYSIFFHTSTLLFF